MKSFTDILQRAEHLADFLPQNAGKRPYKIVGDVWIKGDLPLIKTYHKTLKNSELPVFPSSNFKIWGVFVLQKLKGRNTNHNFRKLLGYGLSWSFLKNEYVPLNADIIYYRKRAIVMIYTMEKKVIKVALSASGKRDMGNEVESQRLAASIAMPGICVSKIIKEFHENDLDFTLEEYFVGKKQSYKDRKILQANYDKVFKFLIEFYLKNPIELEGLSDSQYLNHDFVEEYIQNLEGGEALVSIYKKILSRGRKMIKCRIHGDLNHNNILSNGNQICIIDWGQSKHNYLALELNNSSYNTKPVFEELIEKAKINPKQIYSYEEQLFLGKYIEMNRSVHGKIKSKKITPHFYKWIESENIKLLEMGRNLNL